MCLAPLFIYIEETIMGEAWSLTRDIAEVIGMFLVPVMAWVMYTILSHGKQIIILEEKVNDSLNRRMASIEDRVVGMETKIENKIDGLEKNVVFCMDDIYFSQVVCITGVRIRICVGFGCGSEPIWLPGWQFPLHKFQDIADNP